MKDISAIARVPDSAQETPRVRRVQNILAGALVVLYLALAWQGREPTGVGGADELEYRALSQSIEQGSYREIFQPDAPRAIKYPPAFPAWLALLRKVTGDHLEGVRVANILFAAAALTMVFLIVRVLAGGWVALSALGATAVNSSVLEFTGSMLSEPLYILTSIAALGAAFLAHRGRARMAGVAIAFALLAFLTRTAGITVVVAIGVWLLMRWRRSELIAYVVACVVVLGAWFGYVALQPQDISRGSYGRELSEVAAAEPSVPAAVGLASRAVRMGRQMATGTLVVGLGLPTIQGTVVDNIAWLIALILLLPLGLLVLWRGWAAMAAYVVIYGGLILVWPYSNNRILVVILPLLLPSFFIGARTASRMLPGATGRGVFAVFVALMMVGGVRGAHARYVRGNTCDREDPWAPGCYLPHARPLVRAGVFIRAHLKPGDIAVSSKAPSFYFMTGLQTIPSRLILAAQGTAVETMRARKVRFVILSRLFRGEDGGLAEAILPQCRETKVEFTDLPNTVILSLRSPGETSDEACAVIPEFLKGFPEE